MTSSEIRQKFLKFFESKDHKIISSAPLVPENDPTTLFNTAGMQPLVPYLMGKTHPAGKRLANIQKCVRTGDIDEVGDNTHATFFEMMGNWSLGDYFKKEAIEWSFELLTNKETGFGLNPQRLYVTCFEGNTDVPKDIESAEIWKNIFEKNNVTGERIYFMPAKNNWWQPGPNGPCGPDTEMFYDLTGELDKGMTKAEYLRADDAQQVVEIWNDVFMEYVKKDDKVVGKLASKNVDTGSGFERVTAVLQGKNNIFDTDIFESVMVEAGKITSDIRSKRIISDHIRTAVFMIADGVSPSNTDQGYVLRRLIRRTMINSNTRYLPLTHIQALVTAILKTYSDVYPEMQSKSEEIISVIYKESEKFAKTLVVGIKEYERMRGDVRTAYISGAQAAALSTTFGLPIDVIFEIAKERGDTVDIDSFKEEFKKHQDLSRAGSEQKFKGGLAGTGEAETRYHTATHLLHQALREVLGNTVQQKGSNITPERLRFDFAYNQKMTDEEKKKVEDIVNQKIKEDLKVNNVVLPKEEAEKTGALHFFGDKYGDQVSIYYIGDSLETAYSKEFCGGPHVSNTGILGTFKIQKEEAVSAGVRRIKAILE